jgi:hypothetical protein
VLVAERDDAMRDELIDRLSADAFDAEPARIVAAPPSAVGEARAAAQTAGLRAPGLAL